MKTTLILLLILCSGSLGFSQSSSKNYATIEYSGEKTANTRSYIGKLKKGDPYRLNDYLQSGTNDQTDVQKPSFAPKEYESKKDRNQTKYLSDVYHIDEKKLKKNKKKQYQKYLKEKKRVFVEKAKVKPTKKNPKKNSNLKGLFASQKKKTRLSQKFKIKGKRLRKGKKLKYPSGKVSMIIKYEVRDGKTVKTYVTSMNSSVQAGKKYYLKYYGNESQRKYFLEPAPGN